MKSNLLNAISGGSVIPFPIRERLLSFNISMKLFKTHFYIMCEEDLSNFLSETGTIITNN